MIYKMYGVNPIVIAEIASTILTKEIFINGVSKMIINEIIKYSINKDIKMIKVLFHRIANEDEKIFNKISNLLKERLSEEEYLAEVPAILFKKNSVTYICK